MTSVARNISEFRAAVNDCFVPLHVTSSHPDRKQGTTVSTWIRARRLEQCRRDLLDPVFADRPVAAIAARWGFMDAAHFSRAFKAAFEVSPSEFRAAH